MHLLGLEGAAGPGAGERTGSGDGVGVLIQILCRFNSRSFCRFNRRLHTTRNNNKNSNAWTLQFLKFWGGEEGLREGNYLCWVEKESHRMVRRGALERIKGLRR